MEELLANADPAVQLLYTVIEGTLFCGGLVAAFLLLRHQRLHPADMQALTNGIVARSWNTFQLGIVLGSLLLLYLLASFSGLLFYAEQIPLARLCITLVIYTLIVILVSIINRRRGGSWAESCGMGLRNLKKLALSPVFYLAIIPFLMLATKAYHLLLQHVFGIEMELQEVAKIIAQKLSWLQILYAFTAIFAAPLYEELIFRGLAFPYLVKRAGLAGGTALVSLLFALMHFHVPSLVPLFLLSCALCLAYWRTGSLWVNIGMHTIFNAVSILVLNMAG
ncbi:MAG: CPBP family intramembrane metalloprotease [Kiritimatiellales bacterium]|nr:CPBP family intramembrane metalloprotease [Kiritimatiellales bacterium]